MKSQTFSCGSSYPKPEERSTHRFDRALKKLKPARLIDAPSTHQASPTLWLYNGSESIAFNRHTPELIELVEAARELTAVEDPVSIDALDVMGCQVVIHTTTRAIRPHPGHLLGRDLMICESGAWFRFEDGHRVRRGWMGEGVMSTVVDLTRPVLERPQPERPEALLCPTVRRRYNGGLFLYGKAINRNTCGMPFAEEETLMQTIRNLVPFPYFG